MVGMTSLKDKVTVVTGATSGIGAAMARLFVAEGAYVVLAGRREDEGLKRVAELGDRAAFVRTDVTVEADVEALVEQAVERHGRVDVMVNNAGGPSNGGPVTEYDADAFTRTLAVHVTGTLLGTKYAGRQMAVQRSGSIINLGSLAGRIAGWSGLDYSVAKAAVIHLSRCAAVDLGQYGVRVNCVSPGFVPTGIFAKGGGLDHSSADATAAKLAAGAQALVVGVQALEEVVRPEDVAAAALWLAGDGSALVTGQEIAVDGGVSAGRPPSAMADDRNRIRNVLTS
jgi:NAD(P)-dependent dehydrogenase (short-subunit alcohol dehydrogenase family)